MMVNGVWIYFMNASNAFIFAQDWAKHPFSRVAFRSRIAERCNALELVIVEHCDVSLASPTPEHFHRFSS